MIRKPSVFLLAVCIIIFGSAIDSVGDNEAGPLLKEGLSELRAGNFTKAAEALSAASAQPYILTDYALYYLSEAYHEGGDHGRSLETIRSLLGRYPQSPLTRKARFNEVREAQEMLEASTGTLFGAYVKDYPHDEEARYLYGLFLKKSEEPDKAVGVFKKIYIKAGSYSNEARAELQSGDIEVKDLIARASNLAGNFQFKEAEHDLRKALSMDSATEKEKETITKNLGYALFRQKKYRDAAALYRKVGDAYYVAYSLYRAGDDQGFEEAIRLLLEKGDKKAGLLQLAVAADKRRDCEYEAARSIYSDIISHYPSEKEDALWGLGWTYYREGDFEKASDIFSKLYSQYAEPKYLYWHARSKEALGKDADSQYRALLSLDNNFYSSLASAKNKGGLLTETARREPPPTIVYEKQARFNRVEALIDLDMKKDAVSELMFMSNQTGSAAEMVPVIARLLELGEFKRAIILATRIPYSSGLHRLWYPLAYWDIVEKAAKKHDIDPLITLSVMREESRFDAEAASVAGARGLMQLMPETALRLEKTLHLGIKKEAQIKDANNNINLGTFYLKVLLDEFKSLPHALAAYNAGEIAVRKWEQKGNYKKADEFIEDIPYAETRNYVKKVLNSYFQYRQIVRPDATGADTDVLFGSL